MLRIRDPGSGMGKNSGSGSGMNNPDHVSEILKLFFGLKYLNSMMRIRDPEKFGSGIRDKHPGSVTLQYSANSMCFFLFPNISQSYYCSPCSMYLLVHFVFLEPSFKFLCLYDIHVLVSGSSCFYQPFLFLLEHQPRMLFFFPIHTIRRWLPKRCTTIFLSHLPSASAPSL